MHLVHLANAVNEKLQLVDVKVVHVKGPSEVQLAQILLF